METLPELKVTVFSDYICPFCYVGHHRLMRLKDTYDLKINWCFLEIHPEISAEGNPITDLAYTPEQRQQKMTGLERVATEENIPIRKMTFTTNSKDALLLSEASKKLGRDIFYRLHEQLFAAFFAEGKNIGDRQILHDIAQECGVDELTIEDAWNNEQYNKQLVQNYMHARKYEIQNVPSFVFGERVLTGVVTENVMRDAAAQLELAGAY